MKAPKNRTQPVNLRIISNGRQASTFSVSTAWQPPNPVQQQAGARGLREARLAALARPRVDPAKNMTPRALLRMRWLREWTAYRADSCDGNRKARRVGWKQAWAAFRKDAG